MTLLGTRNIWKPRPSNKNKSEKDSQILKNQGYISVFLEKVHYQASPHFFQKVFGGKDKVAIMTTTTYKTPGRPDIEAKIVLGSSTVDANVPTTLSKSCLIALNVPTQAEGLELRTTISSIKKDNFERTIDLLSDESFQAPLELDPIGIGKVLTIANMVRKIFTTDEKRAELEGSFAGLISRDSVDNPVENNRLTDGYLIMISNLDKGNDFLNEFDPELLTYTGKELLYDKKKLNLTHIVYSIHFIPAKGENEQAVWAKKYQHALNSLDDLLTAFTRDGQRAVLKKSLEEWKNGNLLLDNDPTYIQAEKQGIKQMKYLEIQKHYKQHVDQTSFINGDTISLAESLLTDGESPVSRGALEQNQEITRNIFIDNQAYAEKLFEQMEDNVKQYQEMLKEAKKQSL
ncbi:MAG: hypothetical protein AAF587_39820 [Bacteroidota bacterium]